MEARDKVCFAVGAASGLGRLAAQRWARAGGIVAAVDIDEDGLRETAAGFDSIRTWHLDVTNRHEVDAVVKTIETRPSDFQPLYPDNMPLWDKTRTIAQEIYGAEEITADKAVKDKFAELEKQGFGNLPICVAKTQYSFTTDPNAKGVPLGHTIPIREIRLSAGAEFVVVICGDIMTMPGLPRVPAANNIELAADGRISGLF